MVRTPWLICMLFALTLSACGFHLREQATFALPFQSLYVKAASNYSPFIIELKQAVVMNGTQVEESPETAQVTLEIVSEVADKQILSLSGAGRVREYRLQYRISLRLVDSQQKEWLPPSNIVLHRDYSYDDTQLLAKEKEEALLNQDMRTEAVQQILRRLNHAKAPQPAE